MTLDIKLIAIDLDGTLLDSKKKLTAGAAEAIEAVRREKDVKVLLSTARPPRSTMPFYRQLELNEPMINFNGALIWEPDTGQILYHKPIPLNVARGLVRWAKQRFPGKVFLSANIGEKWFVDFRDHKANFEAANLYVPDQIAPWTQWLDRAPTKLMLLGDPPALDATEQVIRKTLSDQLRPYRANPKMLQLMHATASKCDALKRITSIMGLQREEVMAIGDNVNDAGMIQWAGAGVSMANGHVICLQIADHITDCHDEGGVASIVQHYLLDDKTPTFLT